MERFCDRCGSIVSGEVKFCPSCGSPMQSAVDLNKTEDIMPQAQQTQMINQPVQPNYGYNPNMNMGYGAPQYGQSYNPNNAPAATMTTGQWIGTILLCTCFGLISFILTAVWAFGSDTPEPKRGFCKGYFFAQLIFMAISTLMAIIIFIVLGFSIDKIIRFAEGFENFEYHYNW